MAGNRIKSLRYSIWSGDIKPQDIGEALRDLWTAFSTQPRVAVTRLENFVWAPPFYIAHDHPPDAVLLGRAKLAQLPAAAAGGFVAWTFDTQGIRIDTVTTLTVGTAYDLAFVVVG